MIKESIFLFYDHRLIELNDINPEGVWVTLLGKNHGKTVLRILVQTKNDDSYNFAININDNHNNMEFTNPYLLGDLYKSVISLKKNYNIILKINNSIVNINIYFNEENIKKFVLNIVVIISYIFHLMKKDIGNCYINYYLTNHKKLVDNDIKNGLNYNHINNGCCSTLTNSIDIWRTEEIMRVTIHELFHLFN